MVVMMPSPYEDLFKSIRCKFVDEVQAILGLPTQYDNAPFTKPTNSGWVRFSIKPDLDRQADVGGEKRRYRISGVAVASVFFPINQGDLGNIQAADSIANVFRGVTFQGVTFTTPLVQNLGREGKEWRTDVRCPFQTDNFF